VECKVLVSAIVIKSTSLPCAPVSSVPFRPPWTAAEYAWPARGQTPDWPGPHHIWPQPRPGRRSAPCRCSVWRDKTPVWSVENTEKSSESDSVSCLLLTQRYSDLPNIANT